MLQYRYSKGKETIECFTNTPSEDVCAISPQRQLKLSKRISAKSKMSVERGKICTGHMRPRVRLMTQWIGQSTLTSTKIGADAVLVSESDSESFGTWQQKPIF